MSPPASPQLCALCLQLSFSGHLRRLPWYGLDGSPPNRDCESLFCTDSVKSGSVVAVRDESNTAGDSTTADAASFCTHPRFILARAGSDIAPVSYLLLTSTPCCILHPAHPGVYQSVIVSLTSPSLANRPASCICQLLRPLDQCSCTELYSNLYRLEPLDNSWPTPNSRPLSPALPILYSRDAESLKDPTITPPPSLHHFAAGLVCRNSPPSPWTITCLQTRQRESLMGAVGQGNKNW